MLDKHRSMCTNWKQVNSDGFGDSNNVVTHAHIAFDGYLYAEATNCVTGGQIWRSSDGVNWTQVGNCGFGDYNVITQPTAVFNGYLYAETMNRVTGGEIWRYDGTNWEQANSDGFNNSDTFSSFINTDFRGELYAGCTNYSTGGQIWKSSDDVNWEQV